MWHHYQSVVTLTYVAVFAGSALAGSPTSANPDKPAPPAATESTDHIVLWRRGDGLRTGRIDRNGNFVPVRSDALVARPALSGPGPVIVYNQTSGNIDAYEHRSLTLIPGTKRDEVFVPEIGGRVIELGPRVGVGKVDRLIYNRPDSAADFWTPERLAAARPNGLPRVPTPAEAGNPSGYELVPFARAFPGDFPGGEPRFARAIGEVVEFGRLNHQGEFIPDYGLPVLPVSAAPPPLRMPSMSDEWRITYNRPRTGSRSERVYEYRSGRLIIGTLDESGNFSPEVGSRVLNFKDYQPRGNQRIYNLPGVLRPVKQ